MPDWVLVCWWSGGRAAADAAQAHPRVASRFAGQDGVDATPTCLPAGRPYCFPCLQVLTEDILPALDKLRQEKSQYIKWQSATKSQEKLMRFCAAFRYMEALK